MQAKLPDINAAIVRHRSFALEALNKNDMYNAAISLSSINALLPDEYKVEVNTSKYNDIVKSNTTIKCLYCDTEHQYDIVKVYDLLLPINDQILTSKKTIKVWNCPKCKETNNISKNKKTTVQFQKPFYVKVVPEAPSKNMLEYRLDFYQKFKKWFSIALEELEYQIGLYRADYQAQQDGIEQPEFDEDE